MPPVSPLSASDFKLWIHPRIIKNRKENPPRLKMLIWNKFHLAVVCTSANHTGPVNTSLQTFRWLLTPVKKSLRFGECKHVFHIQRSPADATAKKDEVNLLWELAILPQSFTRTRRTSGKSHRRFWDPECFNQRLESHTEHVKTNSKFLEWKNNVPFSLFCVFSFPYKNAGVP